MSIVLSGNLLNNMMKKLLLILFLAPCIVSAQCVIQKDSITGRTTIKGIARLGAGSIDLRMPVLYFAKQDTSFFIGFEYVAPQSREDFNFTRLLLLVKFEDGTIKRYHAGPSSGIGGVPGRLTFVFSATMSFADVLYFRDFTVTFIRLSLDGNEGYGYEPPVRAGTSLKIKNAAACVQ